MNNKGKRIFGLDYMRGLACILVLLYHYTTRLVELFPEFDNKWNIRVPFGYMGVCVFFLLSGYLSLMQHKDNTSIKMYFKNKFTRLYPSYWCAVITTFIITRFFLIERSVSVKSFLINMTMLESFLGVDLVDGAYWTLANEIVFYTFIALFFVILKQKSKFSYLALGWVILANLVMSFEYSSFIFLLANKLFMTQYSHMFLAGGFIFCFFSCRRISERVINVVGWLLCIGTQFRLFTLDYGVFFLASNIMIICCILFDNADFKGLTKIRQVLQPLTFLASISYPLYLIHQNIGYAILVNIFRSGIQSEVIIVIPMVVVTIVGYLMHILIENNCRKKY